MLPWSDFSSSEENALLGFSVGEMVEVEAEEAKRDIGGGGWSWGLYDDSLNSLSSLCPHAAAAAAERFIWAKWPSRPVIPRSGGRSSGRTRMGGRLDREGAEEADPKEEVVSSIGESGTD